MTHSVKQLIAALREELQQYGEMLARLDEQQSCVLRRAADDLMHSIEHVQTQGTLLEQHRSARQKHQHETALALGLSAEATFAEIIPALPEVYRPLVDALVQENNDLLVRVQQRARQNHLLLSRSVELMQNLLGSLLPVTAGPAYNQRGAVFANAMPSRNLYEAVG